MKKRKKMSKNAWVAIFFVAIASVCLGVAVASQLKKVPDSIVALYGTWKEKEGDHTFQLKKGTFPWQIILIQDDGEPTTYHFSQDYNYEDLEDPMHQMLFIKGIKELTFEYTPEKIDFIYIGERERNGTFENTVTVEMYEVIKAD